MDAAKTASDVLDACGGAENILSNAICMTRLRLVLANRDVVDSEAILGLHGVLAVRMRGDAGVEVVFGPAIVDAIGESFANLTGRTLERKTAKAITRLTANGPMSSTHLHSTASYGGASADEEPEELNLDELRQLFESRGAAKEQLNPFDADFSDGSSVLVLNGPNLNMLGVREPAIYGSGTYADLVALCERAGAEVGFAKTTCFQTNHEGVLVDKIQAALGTYDGIVINPAAYTHTSVAILDALKAVDLPAVEVHISDVASREDFRQVSYVRAACIATVSGEGFDGYAHALKILHEHLAEHK